MTFGLRQFISDQNENHKQKINQLPDYRYWIPQSTDKHNAALLVAGIDPRNTSEMAKPCFTNEVFYPDGGQTDWGCLSTIKQQLFTDATWLRSSTDEKKPVGQWFKDAKELGLMSVEVLATVDVARERKNQGWLLHAGRCCRSRWLSHHRSGTK